jgi:hypothetical protein
LERGNALDIAGATKDNFVPGEVTYLNLGGFNDYVYMGKVFDTGAPLDEIDDLRFAYQTSFTSAPVELTPHLLGGGPGFTPPPGVEGFWLLFVPEPTSFGLAGFGLLSLASVCRRRS